MRCLVKIPLLFFLAVLISCNSADTVKTPVFKGIEDFSGRKISAATGSNQEAVLAAEYPSVEILRFDTDADLLQSLMTRRSDAIAMDLHIFSYFNQVVDVIVALEKPLITAQMGFCFGKGYNAELRGQFNEFLQQLKEDGTYYEIVDRWINNAHTSKMPDIPLPEGENPIRVATNTGSPPLVFIKDGEIVGFDAEIVMRFAAYVSEMFRSAIESVDKGQTEAGVAMGFTPLQTFVFIVMPQAFKQVLPVFKGETISLVKTTSIVGFIAVQDLTKVGDIIRSRTFDAL